VAIACAAALAGCGSSTPSGTLESGRAFLEKKDYAAAIIQFKNVIQKSPDSAEARFLLATALADSDKPAEALVEFRKARDLGYKREDVDRRIAAILLDIGDSAGLLKEDLRAETPEGRADLRSAIGDALLSTGDQRKAEAAFAEALQAAPGYPRAVVGQARMAAAKGDLASARRMLDEVLKRDAAYLPGLLLRAEVAKAQRDPAAATADLEGAIAARPRHMGARFTLAILQLETGARDRAEAQLAEMRKVSPGDPRTSFVEAMIRSGKGETQPAYAAIQRTLKDMPDYVPALVLGGALAAQTNNLAQSEANLRRALELVPGHLGARRILTGVYLRTGDLKRAQETIAPAMSVAAQVPEVAMLAAEVAIAQGDMTKAAQLLQQATAADPKNAAALTRLGELRLREGNLDAALNQYELAQKADPSGYRADLAKVVAYMSRRQFDQAMKAWSSLEAKQPKNPLTYDLQGQIFLAQNDRSKARASFEKAVGLEATYYPAQNRLAGLDISEGNHAAARKRYEELAKANPRSATPLIALAQVAASAGAPPLEITETLQRAVRADAASPEPHAALVNWLLRINEGRRALTAAQEGAAAFPGNRAMGQLLGRAQLANGESQQAIATLTKLAGDGGVGAADTLVLLARAHMQAKNPAAAAVAMRRAVEAQPNSVPLRREFALVLVDAKEPQRAVEEARKIRSLTGGGAAAAALVEGEILAAQQKWPEAIQAYRQSLSASRDGLAAVRLHGAMSASGKPEEASNILETFRRENPKDAVVPAYIADLALKRKDYPVAVRALTPLVEAMPSNVIHLNNLAWAAAQVGDPKAEAYAERAFKLDPYSPAVVDTMGWVLLKKGDVARALPLLERAARQAPETAEIRLHYAEALAKSNRKDDARREAEAIMKLPASPAREAAAALVKTL
jgi:putative PEP-CTERM system TPR-repeat lipoprotein